MTIDSFACFGKNDDHFPPNLLGAPQVLLRIPEAPVVYLLDESHTHLSSTDENITNARILVDEANVELIGVESHVGGATWDDFEGIYHSELNPDGETDENFDDGTDVTAFSDFTRLADALRSSKAKVVGVECAGMANQQHTECGEKGIEPGEHPLNRKRSEHFIRTLTRLRSLHKIKGNMVLNVGSEHNNHVVEWIKDGTIESKAGEAFSYVRLRPPSHPANG